MLNFLTIAIHICTYTNRPADAQENLLAHVQKNKAISSRGFAFEAPLIWEMLPKELRRDDMGLTSFKSKLKTNMFRRCFEDFI